MASAFVLILWVNRGTTFWVDELIWYLESPEFDLRHGFEPHLGHLVLTSRGTYHLLFELFGASYVPFRILAPATLILAVGLLFTLTARRVGGYVALAPCVVLLFLGSDWLHVLLGNGFTVVGAVACGLGAFLALERESRRGDIVACALLCLGVATYSVALGFVLGATVWIFLGDDWRRRVWIVLIPLVLYGIWWLWSRDHTTAVGSDLSLSNVLLIPAWSFQSLSAALSALIGVSYQFPGGAPAPQIGPVLATAALLGVGLRLAVGSVPRTLWASIAVLVGLWTMGALTAGEIRFPENPRYLFPALVGIVLVAAESVRGVRWSRAGMVALFVVAAAGVGSNLIAMRDYGAWLRHVYSPEIRATFTALDLAGANAEPRLDFAMPDGTTDPNQNLLADSLAHVEERGEAVRDYFVAAERYGSLGYSLEELRVRDNVVRERADTVLAQAMELRPVEAAPSGERSDCTAVGERGAGPVPVTIPSGGAQIEVTGVETAPVSIGRFADGEAVPLGKLIPARPVRLPIPPDRAPEPWRVSTEGSRLVVCPLR
jgi:hypothetical protein